MPVNEPYTPWTVRNSQPWDVPDWKPVVPLRSEDPNGSAPCDVDPDPGYQERTGVYDFTPSGLPPESHMLGMAILFSCAVFLLIIAVFMALWTVDQEPVRQAAQVTHGFAGAL